MSDKEPRSRREYEADLIAECRKAFAKHTIASRGDGRWILREPGTSNMQCEIVALAWGTLLVHGDFDCCVWTGYSGKSGPEALVAWIGRHTDVHYVSQKAQRGLDDYELVEEVKSEVLVRDLRDYLAECEAEYAGDEEDDEAADEADGEHAASEEDDDPAEVERREEHERVKEALEEAIESAEGDEGRFEMHAIVARLIDDGVIDSEYANSLGVVTTRRVIRAWQAVVRLHELLTEESATAVKNGEVASVEGA